MTPRQATDQRECPHTPMRASPIEIDGHLQPSRGQAGCGLVALLRRRGDLGAGAIARLFCKRRACPDCGPRRCARLRARYLELISAYLKAHPDAVLVTFDLAAGAWATRSRMLRRYGLPVLRTAAAGGTDRILTVDHHRLDRGVQAVPDLQAYLAREFTWTPGSAFDNRRVSDARWDATDPPEPERGESPFPQAEKPQAKATVSAAGDKDPQGWELLGFVGRTYADAVALADRRLGMNPEPVPERELPDDWAEAHAVQLPAEASPAWWRMWHHLDLRYPTTRLQDRDVREHRRRMRTQGRPVQDKLPGVAA